MRILIVTSCTGEKVVSSERQLTQEDFLKGNTNVKKRENQLSKLLTPARDLYSGQQHVRLMRGIKAATAKESKLDIKIDLKILSAGYGMIFGGRKIAPYEITFNNMKKKELREWADQLNIPKAFRKTVSKQYDLVLILLGDKYLEACDLGDDITFGGQTFIFCGGASAKKLPELKKTKVITINNKDATRFSCGLIGLKGELAFRLLSGLANNKGFKGKLLKKNSDVLSLLDSNKSETTVSQKPTTTNKKAAKSVIKQVRGKAKANPKVDQVIQLPDSWKNKPHRKKLRYFIPEWDDLVDPDYDFETDTHSGGIGDWSNQVYAHQMYKEPNYDGILVSRAVAEQSKKKNARINEMGVHRFLRVPREYPIMGDCGAFDYIDKDEPPYTTDDVIDYYTRLDFDYGVSVDHLVVPAFESQKQFRYDLTIQNAEAFLKEHKKLGLRWEPIGAVQGWDRTSYVKAAKNYVDMGYKYIALGGLVRSQTPEIIETVQAVRHVVPKDIQIHVFGFSRFDGINELSKAGADSIDSASMLRKAWLGANMNYLTMSGWYSAIRVPQAESSFRAKKLVKDGKATLDQLKKLEKVCLSEIRAFARNHKSSSQKLIEHLVEYDTLLAGERKGTSERIQRTLDDRPWEKCGCAICQRWGVEVVIFRGNNRNRRRGFHNTFVFYQQLQRVLLGDALDLSSAKDESEQKSQLELFRSMGATGT